MWAVTYIDNGTVRVDLFSGLKNDKAQDHARDLLASGYTNVHVGWASIIE